MSIQKKSIDIYEYEYSKLKALEDETGFSIADIIEQLVDQELYNTAKYLREERIHD